MAYIKLDNISKIYGHGENETKALDNVSFEINEGEVVVILGASGAGKSTLLNILGGMDSATSGSYIIDNKEVTAMNYNELTKFRKEDIGFVFQFYNLMPNLTALENVSLAINSKDDKQATETLKRVGLENRSNNFPFQLSGGEQQRVSIARAVVKEPKLLLCDEPTGALDSKTGIKILEVLVDMAKVNKNTVIIVTHNANIASVSDRIIKISDGKIIENTLNTKKTLASEVQW